MVNCTQFQQIYN